MLERYSHIRMAAKRHAVAGVGLHQGPLENTQISEMVPVKVPVVEQPLPIQ
jgi:hypothetical protein